MVFFSFAVYDSTMAAKAGVMALTRSAAVEAAQHGVRVNAVAPSLASVAATSDFPEAIPPVRPTVSKGEPA